MEIRDYVTLDRTLGAFQGQTTLGFAHVSSDCEMLMDSGPWMIFGISGG